MNNFSNFGKSQRRFDMMFNFIVGFIIVMFITIIGIIGFSAVFLYDMIDVIKAEGLKSVAETIWNGVQ